MEQLPERQFQAGSKLTDKEKEDVLQALDELQIETTDSPLASFEFREAPLLVSEAHDYIRNELLLDVGSRLPKVRKIRFVDSDEMRKLSHPTTLGFHNTEGDIVVLTTPNHALNLNIFTHELGHCLSKMSITIKDDEQETIIGSHLFGFHNQHANELQWFNEINNDLFSIELAARQKRNQGSSVLTNFSHHYKNGVTMLDLAISEIERQQSLQKDTFRKELYRAYVKGDTSFLRIFNHVAGEGFLKYMSTMTKNIYPNELVAEIGHKYFGIEPGSYLEKVDRFDHGDPIVISNGRSIQLAPERVLKSDKDESDLI